MLMGVLGHVTDHDEARSIVAGLMDGLPSGSYLAINDSVNTSEALEEALRVYEASGAVPYRTRSPEQFASYFDGLELVEPGVVLVADWRPDPGADRGPRSRSSGPSDARGDYLRALLTSSPEGACDYLDANIRNPAAESGASRRPR